MSSVKWLNVICEVNVVRMSSVKWLNVVEVTECVVCEVTECRLRSDRMSSAKWPNVVCEVTECRLRSDRMSSAKWPNVVCEVTECRLRNIMAMAMVVKLLNVHWTIVHIKRCYFSCFSPFSEYLWPFLFLENLQPVRKSSHRTIGNINLNNWPLFINILPVSGCQLTYNFMTK